SWPRTRSSSATRGVRAKSARTPFTTWSRTVGRRAGRGRTGGREPRELPGHPRSRAGGAGAGRAPRWRGGRPPAAGPPAGGGGGVSVRLSRDQARWLGDIEERSGGSVDAGAVLRALVDLAAELDIDWTRLSNSAELRAEVRRAVLVRRRGEPPPAS